MHPTTSTRTPPPAPANAAPLPPHVADGDGLALVRQRLYPRQLLRRVLAAYAQLHQLVQPFVSCLRGVKGFEWGEGGEWRGRGIGTQAAATADSVAEERTGRLQQQPLPPYSRPLHTPGGQPHSPPAITPPTAGTRPVGTRLPAPPPSPPRAPHLLGVPPLPHQLQHVWREGVYHLLVGGVTRVGDPAAGAHGARRSAAGGAGRCQFMPATTPASAVARAPDR